MRSSYSRLGAYAFCARKYEYRYVRELPAPAKPELAFGAALHESLEENFSQKVETRRDLPAPVLALSFRHRLRERLSPVPEALLRGPADPHYLQAMGEHFLHQFLARRAPSLQPAPGGVEAPFRLPLPGGHEVTGQFDLLDTDGVLHDFKTSNKPYDPRRADRTQLVIYAWACEGMFGRPPRTLCFDVFVKGDGAEGETGLQAPVFFPAPSPSEMGQVARRLSALVDRVARAERAGDFPRAFPPDRCHWCEYQDVCRREWAWEGEPAAVRVRPESLA